LPLWIYPIFLTAGVIAVTDLIGLCTPAIRLQTAQSSVDSSRTGIALLLLMSLCAENIAFMKIGASFNYLIGSYVLSCIMIVECLASRIKLACVPNRRQILPIVAVIVIFLANALLLIKTIKARAQVNELASLNHLPSDSWLGDSAFVNPYPETHAVSDPLPYATHVRAGTISIKPLLSRIQGKKFSIVVLSPTEKEVYFSPQWLPQIGQALHESYGIETSMDGMEVWKLKSSGTHP